LEPARPRQGYQRRFSEAIQPGSSKVPSGARLMDLSRYTVLPGLIDCHTHLIGELQSADVLRATKNSNSIFVVCFSTFVCFVPSW
jgi:dihydroorotase-like cyclic amidohydrolase